MLNIIPVIDLLNGEVVHAKLGQRHLYQAIQSKLVRSSQPLTVVEALLDIYPFNTLYIADLNAIQFQQYTRHDAVIESILTKHPDLSLWLDNGNQAINNLHQQNQRHINKITATESLSSFTQYQQATKELDNNILSLDFLHDGYKGPIELIENAHYWPDRVIIMTLQQVGSNLGTATTILSKMLAKRSHHQLFAAGGVRHVDDLILLKEMQMNGVLIASALHNQQIKYADIAMINQ